MSIKCWVVMGNDFPAAVLASEAAANEYILFRKWDDLVKPDYQKGMIHWRHYEFSLDTEYVPTTLQPGKGKKPGDMTTEELRHEWFYWFRKEDGKSGAAASASNEFRRDIETELRRRGVRTQDSLVDAYNRVVDAERRRLHPRDEKP